MIITDVDMTIARGCGETLFAELAADATSKCLDSFGHKDFDADRVRRDYAEGCPVRGCSAVLLRIPSGEGSLIFCAEHGIGLHTNTFVYWNGPSIEERRAASLRNIRVRPDLLSQMVASKQKVETHRLGAEMSEDALSWNVFVALAAAEKLRELVRFLTGRSVEKEPSLYLWGQLIDVVGRKQARFEPLYSVRDKLEKDIRKFKTEPDIMLVVDGKLVISIEAKFGSGNPLAHESTKMDAGDKPTAREGLLLRYLDRAGVATQDMVDRGQIKDVFHSQLFRNIVFASEMAGAGNWHVANLVSGTQAAGKKESKQYSYKNPEEMVRNYLREDVRGRFTCCTWEDLHRILIKPDPRLRELDGYMRSKSAHFRRAFVLA